MKTIVAKPNDKTIKRAAKIIRRGGIVSFPTETVYGLGGNALSSRSSEKIFKAKGRPSDNPLIVHVSDIDEVYALSDELPEIFFRLAEKFWPGALTLIVKKSAVVPKETTGGLDSVAIRMPNNEVALKLIKEAGLPIAAPSANSSGKPSPTEAFHVFDDLNKKIPMIIDGGSCTFGVESTVLSLLTEVPVILRPGAVTKEMLEDVIGKVEISDSVINPLKNGEVAASPGMKYKHYSPDCEVYLVEGSSEEYVKFVNGLNSDVSALCFTEESEKIKIPYLTFGRLNDEISQANELFSKLRELDMIGAKTVYAHAPDKSGVGLAVYNRLIRAAGFKVISAKEKTIIGLTGHSGAGKTTVSEIFKNEGFTVINADAVSRDVSESEKGKEALKVAFGKEIFNNDTLDRKKLADVVFSDNEKLKLLNATILPIICERILEMLNSETNSLILLDAPTLFESGLNRICDKIVSVTADFEILKTRIIERDGLTSENAEKRLSSQKTTQFFKENSDYIVENNENLEELRQNTLKIINEIKNNGGLL